MKVDTFPGFTGPHLQLIAVAEAAGRAIPPLWPLAASVAVNPFLGQTDRTLPEVAALLARVAGQRATMPPDWYAARIAAGTITDGDLAADPSGPQDLGALVHAAAGEVPAALPTVADLAAEASGIDWPGLVADRIGTWAAGHFDAGQALWSLAPAPDAFESWRRFASRDLTPEIAGLPGFAATVAGLPGRARSALAMACDALGLTPAAAETAFHQLLLGLGGWSQLARQRLWQAELGGGTDGTLGDMLAIRLVWEQALFAQYGPRIAVRWGEVVAAHGLPPEPTPAMTAASLLQEAAERASQRDLALILASPAAPSSPARPRLQAVFCIDVRSEVFRRALESLDPGIRTSGFAGFFGLPLEHREFASDTAEARLPVLLSPGLDSVATGPGREGARLKARATRAWGRFRLAAVSSFAFVEATGPVYVGKLLRDALGLAPAPRVQDVAPRFGTGFAPADRIATAAGVLRAMSLTTDFAPLVLIVGHGAGVVNNPHAAALNCGACGGYRGDVNARLLAGLLNEPEVREGLARDGIDIPANTVFAGALHDTTTDAVRVFHETDARTERWLEAAGRIARTERALRLPRAKDGAATRTRATDWAETRPEWALAGCNAFIAAPRMRTRGRPLAGRAFLHDYDWTVDVGFGVLEQILTAPVVVASWIGLQYYGSVVMPDLFGAGNKLLHNVTGGIGVVEGNGGLLRAGLPWQSVHDGTSLAHDPLRLAVVLEAPAKAVSAVLDRHPQVRALFDNRWLHLLLLDGEGRIAQRYAGAGTWQAFEVV